MCFNWFGDFAVSYDFFSPKSDEISVPKAQMLYLTQIYRFSNCECQHAVFFLCLSMNRPFAVQTQAALRRHLTIYCIEQLAPCSRETAPGKKGNSVEGVETFLVWRTQMCGVGEQGCLCWDAFLDDGFAMWR